MFWEGDADGVEAIAPGGQGPTLETVAYPPPAYSPLNGSKQPVSLSTQEQRSSKAYQDPKCFWCESISTPFQWDKLLQNKLQRDKLIQGYPHGDFGISAANTDDFKIQDLASDPDTP
ncbi:hypothetical protein J7T55_011922 [Diaporthe amygdali]|uniref:uncharacterized protein n=1 Tax=Phomopsis amygdali TaxID=1214568 RepID=UPI0022FEB5FD|nr:uncharacterized protein J7T55_011922 [Diaporthe amygdali]KAJ0123457.1 hypothetical protein J7T55_011922 [Diaporthe amygdali]